MKKVLLITGIVLVLVNLFVMACSTGESISGEYKYTGWSLDTRLDFAEDGTFDYKARATGGEWMVKDSGEWDRQGSTLHLKINDYTINARIDGGTITVYTNLKIPIGTWEKVE